MNIRLILVVTLGIFLMAGCQFNQAELPDFTEKPSSEMKDFTIEATFIPKDITVVGLGDSLTQGVGDELKKDGYVGRLTEKMKTFEGVREVELVNLAKRGKRSDQLLDQLQSGDLDDVIRKADFIVMTIGGNDIMRVVKQDFFSLRLDAFQKELIRYTKRFNDIMIEIRKQNPVAPIILMGLYNPFSVVTNQENEFDEIMLNWNQAIDNLTISDVNACYVPVDDLFNSNDNMVYHTDFFHPNSKGYEQMTNRIIESLNSCGLNQLTNGEIDF